MSVIDILGLIAPEKHMGLGLRRRLEKAAGTYPLLRRALTKAYMLGTDYFSPSERHPLDRRYNVRTQHPVPLYLSVTGSSVDGQIVPYGGCVASVLRHVLDRLDLAEETSFVDIGCGKGRALIIASEYMFAQILGVELNADVAAVAHANARRIASRFPDRTKITIEVGDASTPDLPACDAIIFMYHPFGEELVRRICDHLAETRLSGQTITVIYENPVHGRIFDIHPAFTRYYAAMLSCDTNERAFAFDAEEAVVIWRVGASSLPLGTGSDRHLRTVKAGFRVILEG